MIHLFPPSSQSLNKIADKQYNSHLEFSRYRGTIFDRRKEPLAISIRTPSLFVNPKQFKPTYTDLLNIGRILNMSVNQIKRATDHPTRYFAWLKRKVNPTAAAKVKELNIRGLFEVMEPARFYPSGSSAANLLGYVGIDDHGLMGLERQYDKLLGGEPIKYLQSKDARGRTIFMQAEDAAPQKAGHSLILTIDRAIQDIAEAALAEGLKNAKAKGGFVLVSDPHTGKILAIANQPTYDPNDTTQVKLRLTRNQAMVNAFEPGSVVKPLVLAGALEHKLLDESTAIDCGEGFVKIGRHRVNDSHKPENRWQTAEQVVVHSSNVGTYEIAKKLGRNGLYDIFTQFGLGARKFRFGFPGEASGWISDPSSWRDIRFANIAFGQGLMTTGPELVAAYGALANGGRIMKPYLIEKIESPDGKVIETVLPQQLGQAISADSARRVRKVLFKVVEKGAIKARLNLWTAGGKTGTSQKIDPETRAYSRSKHYSTFVGMAPINDPHLVIYVQIDEPNQKVSYGSLWAAPVFKAVAENTLRYLNVAPDRDMTSIAEKENSDAKSL